MNPRFRAVVRALILVGVVVVLLLIFPSALKFAEMAARELRYFWWLILLAALACWLIWGFRKRP
ncbi:MAG TPA: hypothetical protein PKA41_05845 [Verrucomicrobiota bacterium]|nr:hypothetical protein [Verrucomicrobiota bacterium]